MTRNIATIFGATILSAAMLGCEPQDDADPAPDVDTAAPEVDVDVDKDTAATDRGLEGQGHTTMRPAPGVESSRTGTTTPPSTVEPGITTPGTEVTTPSTTPDADGEDTTVPEIDVTSP